jgi:hypothetical protein
MMENKKARPQGRAGLGTGVSKVPLGSHPDTRIPAAAREAVVQMQMVEDRGVHNARRLVNEASKSNFAAYLQSKRLHFWAIVNNFTYSD